MAGVIHIAETAILLLIAYQLGWFAGFAVRKLRRRQADAAAVIPEARLKAAKREGNLEPAIAMALAEVGATSGSASPSVAGKAALSPGELPPDFLDGMKVAMDTGAKSTPPQWATAAPPVPVSEAVAVKAGPTVAGRAELEPVPGFVELFIDEPAVAAKLEPPVAQAPAESALPVPVIEVPATVAIGLSIEEIEALAAPVPERALAAVVAEPAATRVAVPAPEPRISVQGTPLRPDLRPANKPGELWSGRATPLEALELAIASAGAAVQAATAAQRQAVAAKPPQPSIADLPTPSRPAAPRPTFVPQPAPPKPSPAPAAVARPAPAPVAAPPPVQPPAPAATAAVPKPAEPAASPTPPPDSHHGEASDEDAEAAAMRAIESSWRRKPARKPIRDLPEGIDGT